ncbi:DUF5915 domain-containing protein, partial [Bacillus sp. SIMBA_161]
DEINVKNIHLEQSDSSFVDYTLKLNLKVAGKKYGKWVGPLQSYLKELPAAEAKQVVQNGFLDASMDEEGFHLTLDELLVEKQGKKGFASAS